MALMMTKILAVMDRSVLSATSATILLVGASCFAMGYFLSDGRAVRIVDWVGSVLKIRDASVDPPMREEDGVDKKGKSTIDPPMREEDGVDKKGKSTIDPPMREEDGVDKKGKCTKKKTSEPLEIEVLAELLDDFKMVLVVRNDLKMGKGKIAAQCSHATLGLYKKLLRRAPKSLNRWEMCGQVKVVLKSESEEDLLVLQERAKSLQLPTHITIDAGRTQIAPNSRTVMAILGPADVVDDVTGGLKLL